MKGNAKRRNWGDFGWLRSCKVINNITIRYSTYDFLFTFNKNYAFIFYHFRVTESYLLKSPILNYPPAFGTPNRVTLFEFRQDFWHQKTRVPELLCGVIYVILQFIHSVKHQLVTDRWTNNDSVYLVSTVSHGNESVKISFTGYWKIKRQISNYAKRSEIL